MIPSFKTQLGQEVEVSANGTLYRGVLKSVSEEEIFLQGSSRNWTIAISGIRKIRVTKALKTPERRLMSSENLRAFFETKTDPNGEDPKK